MQKKAKNNPNLNETLSKAFRDIEASAQGTASEDDFKGLFADIDVNSNKLGATVQKRNEKLVKILASINELKLGNFTDNTIDAFGDAYEFLMTMYASSAGKSGGEFLRPKRFLNFWQELHWLAKHRSIRFMTPPVVRARYY